MTNSKQTFKKDFSTFSLTMTGLTSILGSGWLLSTQKISVIAGPASIISWVIGMLIALLVSLFFLEIGSKYPSSGGIGYYSRITHGSFCGFITAWINWLSIVAVPPIEAQSIVQYLSRLTPALQSWYNVQTLSLSPIGIAVAFVFMLIFMLINYWSVKLFIRFNNFFSIIKIIIPVLTIIALFATGLHSTNFGLSSIHDFAPFGLSSIFTSVIACGVVMSFNGFQAPLTFSEEIKNPKRMLPIAVVSSILISFLIYLLLQIVFVGSINSSQFAQGWSTLNFRSPYVDLLLMANFHLLVVAVYASAIISPGACGAAFTASCSRILYSLSAQKYLPSFLASLNKDYHNPRTAIVVCTIIGCLFLLLFKGWYELVAVISVIHVISYIPAPIITIANRLKSSPYDSNKAYFKLPYATVLAPILLFILSILLFYSAWPLIGKVELFIVPGLLFYFYYECLVFKNKNLLSTLNGAAWLIYYLIGISLITYLGNNSMEVNFISNMTSYILLAFLSLTTFIYGILIAVRQQVEVKARAIAIEVEAEVNTATELT